MKRTTKFGDQTVSMAERVVCRLLVYSDTVSADDLNELLCGIATRKIDHTNSKYKYRIRYGVIVSSEEHVQSLDCDSHLMYVLKLLKRHKISFSSKNFDDVYASIDLVWWMSERRESPQISPETIGLLYESGLELLFDISDYNTE